MNEDLINEVKALASEVHANETKEDQLRKQLAQVCVDSYNQYIYPMLVQQRNILDAISEALQDDLHLDMYKKIIIIDDVKYNVIIYCPLPSNNKLRFKIEHATNYNTIVSCIDEVEEAKDCWYNNCIIISHFFGNEDAIQMISGLLNDMFIEQYLTIKNRCTNKNEGLKVILDELTQRLNAARAPVKKEDGTVEVMIGGRKFVGKLEEDTNETIDN